MRLRASAAGLPRLPLALLAGALGFVVNGATIPVQQDVAFVFGGAIAMAVVIALGPGYGAVAVGVAASRTVLLWQHPFVLAVQLLEALAVAALVRRRWQPLVADLVFWAAVGLPLVAAYYVGHREIPSPTGWSIVCKQPLNGLLNTLLAELLLGVPAVRRLLTRDRGTRRRALRDYLFVGFATAAIAPLAAVRLVDGAMGSRRDETRAESELVARAAEGARAVAAYTAAHEGTLAVLAQDAPPPGDPRWPARLAAAHAVHARLAAVVVTDRHGRVLASSVAAGVRPADVRSVAATARDAAELGAPRLGAPRRAAVGEPSPTAAVAGTTVPLAVPLADARGRPVGAVAAVLDLGGLAAALGGDERGATLTIADRDGRPVARVGPHAAAAPPAHADGRLALADSAAPVFRERRADARLPVGREILVARAAVGPGWAVYAEQPVHELLREGERSTLIVLACGLGAMVLAVLLALLVTARVTRPLERVVTAVRRLSAGQRDGARLDVPPDATREVEALARDIDEMATRLQASYVQVHEALCERQEAVGRLEEVLDQLDRRVRDRTDALQDALARAEEASAAKSAFLATMSHELRTPLNSVIGFANILRKNRHGTLRADQMLYLERIVSNANHLLLVINDILDLSRIEAGRVELTLAPVAVCELVRETAAQFEAQVRDRGIRLEVVTPTAGALAHTDAARLRQVLINLIGNAVKFTPSGTVTVVVAADPATGALTRVEVRDTGIGIPRDRLASIFDAFTQVDSGAARQFEGTGLGLSISRSLCGLLRLELAVSSEEGAGSTFAIVVPG